MKSKTKRSIKVKLILVLLFAAVVIIGFYVTKDVVQSHNEDKEVSIVEEEAIVRNGDKIEHDPKRLMELNYDCIGWLSINDTKVNYPVMQSKDDPEKYRHLNFYKEQSSSGLPYMDARCDLDSTNIIIYGRNMLNGSQFGCLDKYKNRDYLEKHQMIQLELKDGVKKYIVFAVLETNNKDRWYDFISAADFNDYEYETIKLCERATLVNDKSPYSSQSLLTLSTEYGLSGRDRILVIAKEVKDA